LVVKRFQVMAVVQAARAYVLGMSLESAYSWGLNRSIYIAAAKRGFKGGAGGSGKGAKGGKTTRDVYYLGDDMAYKSESGGVLLFTIGGEVQTKEAFDRQVKSRFGKSFSSAWKEALAYVKEFDKETLLSAEGFFREVYRPKRDEFAQAWTERAESAA
jgi:hypothetical protein